MIAIRSRARDGSGRRGLIFEPISPPGGFDICADVMPQCGEGGRHGEGLIHSTGLQKTLFAPQFGKPRSRRGFLFGGWVMPNKTGRNGATRTERAGRADE